MTCLLEAAGIHFAYGKEPVLRDISLRLSAGETLGLIGPNGSGKSTLIKLLLGHLRGSGTIQWNGRPLPSWRRRELARHLAYLPQSPAYDSGQSVADVLRLGRAPYWGAFGLESEHDLQVVDRVAKLLELDDLLHRPMDELSGGQRQRVFIGRCLAQEPKALLLDEPNTFLDLRHQVDLLHLLQRLAKDGNLAVLMASHDLNLAGLFADRLALLTDGIIAADGPPSRVLDPALLHRAYNVPMERIDRPGNKPPLVFPDLPAR